MAEIDEAMAVQMKLVKELREMTGLNRTEFARKQGIPLRTVEECEAGRRKMPDYLLRLLAYKVRLECNKPEPNNNVSIIYDEQGKSIVIINDVRFKSRNNIDWVKVEEYLKEYIGKCFEIMETAEKIYIGSDFPDEFCHSEDKVKLQGANKKGKANMAPAVRELIQIASNKTEYEDYGKKHASKAKFGWYRYDVRFGLPVYGQNGELKQYNLYTARMLVRCAADGKLYLYDFVRTKKEACSPQE